MGRCAGPNRARSPRRRTCPASWRRASAAPSAYLSRWSRTRWRPAPRTGSSNRRSEEHTSELQSQSNLVCRLLLEKKKKKKKKKINKKKKIKYQTNQNNTK